MRHPKATNLGIVALALCVGPLVGLGATPLPLRTTKGAVAADQALASRAGAQILAQGGNAVDAAVAAALALGVVNPSSSGLGGGGFAIIWLAKERKAYALDFREVAPAKLTREHFFDNGKHVPERSLVGGLAVGVPGEVAGLFTLLERFGTLPFSRVVRPAYRYAKHGFAVGPIPVEYANMVTEQLGQANPFVRWLRPGGKPLVEGRVLTRNRLARTLGTLSQNGRDGFYRGWVAQDMVDAVAARGGVMTLDDLSTYQVVERVPLQGTWNGLQVVTMPLPSSGGVLILEMLGMLEEGRFGLAKYGAGSSSALHVIAELLKHAFADRARLLGADGDGVVTALLERAGLKRLAQRIRDGRVLPPQRYGHTELALATSKNDTGTSHLCAIDKDGNAVALTTTVNNLYGSSVVGDKSGVLMNNQVDDFTIAKGQRNGFGLVQSEGNVVTPGKRPLSSMSPVLVMRDGQIAGCFGGSGGPRIISNTFQAIVNVFTFGMNVREAIEAPRIHHQWEPHKLLYEPRVVSDVVAALRRRGHEMAIVDSVTAVQGIVVRDGGVIEAASDPRKAGAPAAP